MAIFSGIGSGPGIITMPPAVRLTSLGSRQINKAIFAAAQSFACTPRQLLFKVQPPKAMASSMAGVNQNNMMACPW